MNKSRINKYIIVMIACLMLATMIIANSNVTFAADPKLILENYKVDKNVVYTGSKFKLSVKYKNTAAKKIKNVKLTIASENGEILADGTAGIAFIDVIEAGANWDVNMDMLTIAGIEEKSYKLMLKAEYEDVNGNPVVMEDSIYIPISCNQKISVTDLSSDDVVLGDEIELTGKVNNTGDGMLYNVIASLSGETVEDTATFLGNIEAGKSSNIDMLAKSTHLSKGSERNILKVSYEDKMGNVTTEEIQVSFVVTQSDFSNLKQLKKTDVAKKPSGTLITVAVLAVVAVAILVIAILRHNKKKKLLEDF